MASPPAQTLPEGRLFGGRWRIVRCLRAGGMGAVYEVVHRETQARSALKVMLPGLVESEEMRARFRQEAMVTATIESDHIVKVFDGGTDGETGAPYLVMERLRGEDLAARLEARGPLAPGEVVPLLRQAALALERTHAAGVVHRDLKPSNLFLTARDDGSPCLKVLDFGIAKIIASASRAETTRTVGTPLYMAPEQVKGDGAIGAPADLYALAQIAFTLLVGRPYWADEQGESAHVYPVLLAITTGAREPASARAARAGVELGAGFDAWFARATALLPGERFAGARAMIDALGPALSVIEPRVAAVDPPPAEAARSSAPPGARPPSVVGVTRDATPPARRSRWVPLGLGAAAIAATLGLAWSRRDPAPERGALPPAAAPEPAAPPVAAAPAASPKEADVAAASPQAAASAPSTASAPGPAGRPAERGAGGPGPRPHPSASASASARVTPPPSPPRPSDPSDLYRREGTP